MKTDDKIISKFWNLLKDSMKENIIFRSDDELNFQTMLQIFKMSNLRVDKYNSKIFKRLPNDVKESILRYIGTTQEAFNANFDVMRRRYLADYQRRENYDFNKFDI